MNEISVQQMLQRLKDQYIEELPGKFDDLEQLILDYDKSGHQQEIMQELLRDVHSIKGSAGTHGLPMITTVCHNFESQIPFLGNDFTSYCLKYIDLLRETRSVYIGSENPEFEGIEKKLYDLGAEINKATCSALLVDSSRYNQMLVKSIIESYSINVDTASDGIEALSRLTSEKFDLLITPRELKRLNGVALVSALRLSDSINRNINCIMISSTTDLNFADMLKPGKLVFKDKELEKNLASALEELMPASGKK